MKEKHSRNKISQIPVANIVKIKRKISIETRTMQERLLY